eukprot:2549331-Alexandrium_andersonii.AAC.1
MLTACSTSSKRRPVRECQQHAERVFAARPGVPTARGSRSTAGCRTPLACKTGSTATPRHQWHV